MNEQEKNSKDQQTGSWIKLELSSRTAPADKLLGHRVIACVCVPFMDNVLSGSNSWPIWKLTIMESNLLGFLQPK